MPNPKNDFDLSDLISEGKKAVRQKAIEKAAKKVTEARDKTPLPDGPPIRRDIYQQLEWRALSVALVTIHTTCKCCGLTQESPNPSIFIERYHKRHGRHLVEAHNFNLLRREEVEKLPRRIETHYRTSLYCQGCFLNHQESLCLEPQPQPIQESQLSTSLPCVPQQLAIPSPLTLWSDTSARTLKPTNESSQLSAPSKPNGNKEWY